MTDRTWHLVEGDGPIVATAIHDGHALREEVAALTALSDGDRLREEDPYTGEWTKVAATRLVATRSRFEVDLNRPRDKAVYAKPADAWGLDLWKKPPSEALLGRSLEVYDAFYAELSRVLTGLIQRFGGVVVLDLHSYNHRRDGPAGPEADPSQNPEVNVGTGTLDRERWAPVVDRCIADLQTHDFLGRSLDVRENVKFRGGNMSRWINQNFNGRACSIALEFKKFFMDEWSGEIEKQSYDQIAPALRSSASGLRRELRRVLSGGS
ncbi:MAG: N-formylglutamate amidohydrolase [Acidobacteriota bacterium]|nr:N-formylglutamate amidohydrolase [Acidobacteriota bacterium]